MEKLDKGRKKIYHSFEELKEEIEKEKRAKEQKKELLLDHGFDVSEEELGNIEVLKQGQGTLLIRNNITGTLYKSNFHSVLINKWSPCYSIEYLLNEKGIMEQHWYKIEFSADETKALNEMGQLALKAREDKKSLLLSRTYADVKTKYGDLCLHIEAQPTDYNFGPSIFMAIYRGHSDEIMQYNDFSFQESGILKFIYAPSDEFVMYSSKIPEQNNMYFKRWLYGKPNALIGSIYGCDSNVLSGIILENGGLCDFGDFGPHFIRNNSLFERVSTQSFDSKAYFQSGINALAILKNDKSIMISYIKYNPQSEKNEWQTIFEIKMSSLNEGTISMREMALIIEELKASDNKNSFLDNIIRELSSFLIIKGLYNKRVILNERIVPDISNPLSLTAFNFNAAISQLRCNDSVKLVESIIENYATTFDQSLKTVIGKDTTMSYKKGQPV